MKRTQRKKIPGQIPGFFKAEELVEEITLNGVKRRMIVGENAMIMIMEQEPDVRGTPHTHTIENLVYVIQGKLRFKYGDEYRILGPGDGCVIPPNVEHGAIEVIGDEPVIRIDCFSPLLPGMYVPIWHRKRRKKSETENEQS
jgi:quercetin dioxygenase-like cupin family protein